MRTACPDAQPLPGLRRGLPALRACLPGTPGRHEIADRPFWLAPAPRGYSPTRMGTVWGGRVWLVGEVSGELADRGGAGRDPAVRLPPRRSSFVGRTAELGEIAARLGRHTVVTLTGVGGVGKTALAVEAAWIEASAGRAV